MINEVTLKKQPMQIYRISLKQVPQISAEELLLVQH